MKLIDKLTKEDAFQVQRSVARIVKKHFTNLTVEKVLDIAAEVMETEVTSDSNEKPR